VSQFEFLRGRFHSCKDDAADDGNAEITAISQRLAERLKSTWRIEFGTMDLSVMGVQFNSRDRAAGAGMAPD